ncbi:hypothetical protein C8F01DRAFT_967062, partial [Mycena amicta]
FPQHSDAFEDGAEWAILQTSIAAMQQDIRHQYQIAADSSHQGHPDLVQHISDGGRGRPRIYIDPDFLRWAYAHRSTAGISHFLGVSRTTVRNALLEHGIAECQENPFPPNILHPEEPANNPADDLLAHPPAEPFEGLEDLAADTDLAVSNLSDEELEELISLLRAHSLIHGFIDGYSRLITGIRASNNNRAQTVLDLFMDA